MALPRLAIVLATAALLGFAPRAHAQTPSGGVFAIDPAASVVGFTISGSMIFKVKEDGYFKNFTGTVEYDPVHPGNTQVDLTVYTASVDVRDTKHDELLKSPDFFDVERFPTMRFVSASTDAKPDGMFAVTGDMTIRGITRRMTIPVQFRPDQRAGDPSSGVFESTFDIDRTEFGLNGSPKVSGFKVSISRKVQIHIAIATTLPSPR
jgi:polyisoprenoid-binding protein YceI